MANPYGAWRSPLSTDVLVAGDLRLGQPAFHESALIWSERRPSEDGRTVLVRAEDGGEGTDLTPEGFDVRSRVQEYGGGSWWLVGDSIVFSNDSDGRLYRQDAAGGEPVAITPQPDQPRGLRYADGCAGADGTTTFCVRESHGLESATEPVNELVELSLDGSGEPRVIASGHDFFASPRLSPDGAALAYLSWDHPRMPWDGTELWVSRPNGSGAELIAGGAEESICTPAWNPEGILHFVSDRSDWWNLYSAGGAGPEPIAPIEAELGEPAWVFGMQRYAFLDDGRIAVVIAEGGADWLGVIAAGGGLIERLETRRVPVTASLAGDGSRIAFAGASPRYGDAIVVLDPSSGEEREVRQLDQPIDPDAVSVAEEISFPGDGGESHALFYPPLNPDEDRPTDGELPPLLVLSHGGPTSRVTDELELEIQFWTSRGFGVVDVNYGGSTGYGRAYRQRLDGRWGIVDVHDCVAAAVYLAERGDADPKRLAIRGGSAGGYTTLMALTTTDTFAAGASYYGVGDAAALARDTHKFESRYLDRLIGPYPEQEELYRERSPITHVDGLSCPVILFQGLEDAVVPPAQAEEMAAALDRKGIPYAYLAFEGEQHGFRKEETIRRAAEAELAFYGKIFGFEPADEIEPLELRNAPK